MLTPKQLTLNRMRELGIEPKRSMGQNFLIDPYVIDSIVKRIGQELKMTKVQTLLEIGPGLGALTEHLKTKSNESGAQFKIVEMDSTIAQYWANLGMDVIERDALKVDWNSIFNQGTGFIVSNLPYQIGGRLIVESGLMPRGVGRLLFMLQKEVAERLVAKTSTKEYSMLSVLARLVWDTETLLDVSPESFYPMPNVSSRVVLMRRRPFEMNRAFLPFVKQAFAQRRKFLVKAFPGNKDLIVTELAKLGYNEKVRAEEVSPSDLYTLFGSCSI